MSKLVIISDTHELHEQVVLPKGDILVFCGDATGRGSIYAIKKFANWLKRQPFLHKVFVAGNHDFCFENHNHDEAIKIIEDAGAIYLQDSGIEIGELFWYGTPFQPAFFDWAFNLPRNGYELTEKWAAIPEKTNVLISHSPPMGILDETPRGDKVGCADLLGRVKQLPQPKLHCFGHIHHCGSRHLEQDGVLFCNACICDESYHPTHLPIEVEITKEKAFVYKRAVDYLLKEKEEKGE